MPLEKPEEDGLPHEAYAANKLDGVAQQRTVLTTAP